MKNTLILLSVLGLALAGCKKTDLAGNDPTGEGLVQFTLLTPSSGTTVVMNSATPAQTINFSWNAARPGLNITPTYKVVAVLKNGGDFAQPYLEFPSGNSGQATSLSLTYQQLDAALQTKGVAAGATTELKWSVQATNGDVTVLATTSFNLTITRFQNGSTPFLLLAPGSSLSPTTINPTSTSQHILFRWTHSKPAAGSPAVKYTVLFAERKVDPNGNELPVNWDAPLFGISADNTGSDSLATITYKRISDSLSSKGFTNLPAPVQLKWTVRAVSGNWKQLSDYVNNLVIIREVKVYVVGSATPGDWDISKSTRMIEDPRFPGTYFTYIRLTGGNQLKFVNGQAWPPASGAIDWGQDPAGAPGTITDVNEDNINVTNTGIYRVTFDLTNKKYYLQTAVSNGIGGLGMIGNFINWTHPAVKMTYLDVNKFIHLTNMNTGQEFKFHDGNDWNNSANNLHRWFGLNSGNLEVDGGSLNSLTWTGASGLMRTYFDGSAAVNLKYSLTPGKVFLIGGDAAIGNWNNAPATPLPEMTYQGNGQWTVSVTISNPTFFKFIVEKGVWGYQYGDGGPGKVKWRNGDADADPPAISIPAGTHTVTLNEYTQTYSIN